MLLEDRMAIAIFVSLCY